MKTRKRRTDIRIEESINLMQISPSELEEVALNLKCLVGLRIQNDAKYRTDKRVITVFESTYDEKYGGKIRYFAENFTNEVSQNIGQREYTNEQLTKIRKEKK